MYYYINYYSIYILNLIIVINILLMQTQIPKSPQPNYPNLTAKTLNPNPKTRTDLKPKPQFVNLKPNTQLKPKPNTLLSPKP